MPQELNVLRCFSCETFQVHIVKKAKKWQCKICNEKQTITKVFGQGSGKDCRLHAQKLNAMRAGLERDLSEAVLASDPEESPPSPRPYPPSPGGGVGKWGQFLQEEDRSEVSGDEEDLTSVRCVVGRRGKVKGRGGNCGKWGGFLEEPPYRVEREPMRDDFGGGSFPGTVQHHPLVSGSHSQGKQMWDAPRFTPTNTILERAPSPANAKHRSQDSGSSRRPKRQKSKWDEFLEDSESSQERSPPSKNKASANENIDSSNCVVRVAAQPSSPFTAHLYNDDDLDEILKF